MQLSIEGDRMMVQNPPVPVIGGKTIILNTTNKVLTNVDLRANFDLDNLQAILQTLIVIRTLVACISFLLLCLTTTLHRTTALSQVL